MARVPIRRAAARCLRVYYLLRSVQQWRYTAKKLNSCLRVSVPPWPRCCEVRRRAPSPGSRVNTPRHRGFTVRTDWPRRRGDAETRRLQGLLAWWRGAHAIGGIGLPSQRGNRVLRRHSRHDSGPARNFVAGCVSKSASEALARGNRAHVGGDDCRLFALRGRNGTGPSASQNHG